MQPNSFQRRACIVRTVTVDDLSFDLYQPPHGAGLWTPADPIFDVAGIGEADRADFRHLHRMTSVIGGYEIVWNQFAESHRRSVALLSRHAVSGVLANAVSKLDPATIAAIDAALAA